MREGLLHATGGQIGFGLGVSPIVASVRSGRSRMAKTSVRSSEGGGSDRKRIMWL